MPPLAAWTVMVLESSEVAASGGLPVALAVMVQVAPSGEPAIATDPLPVAMVVGMQPAAKQSPIDIVAPADAPDAQRTPEPRTIAVSRFRFMSKTPTNLPDYANIMPSY
jgi:hypothetical protein